jgi:CheY-like chemotaxis protein
MPSNVSVFIIDDDPIYLYMLDRIIRECDFSNDITSFNNGKPALEALGNDNLTIHEIPDVIFVDLSMPIMNGWEFLDKLEEIDILKKKRIKIVLVSSSINPREIELIKKYPIVTKYIVKPITPSDLDALSTC